MRGASNVNPVEVIVLVQGVLVDQTAHHVFVSIPGDRYAAFKQAERKGHYDLRNFGTVMLHAEGLEPTLQEVEQLQNEYGIDLNFEDELKEKLRAIFDHLDKNI